SAHDSHSAEVLERWCFSVGRVCPAAPDSSVRQRAYDRISAVAVRRALLFCASMQRSCVQNPICLSFDERIALTGELFELRPVENGDLAAHILDRTKLLQLAGSGRYAFSAHAQHVCDELLSHHQF